MANIKNVNRLLYTGQRKKIKVYQKKYCSSIRTIGKRDYSVGYYTYNTKKNLVTVTALPLGDYVEKYINWPEEKKDIKEKKRKVYVKIKDLEYVDRVEDLSADEICIEIYLKEGAKEHILEN